jgi:hypothetical protein
MLKCLQQMTVVQMEQLLGEEEGEVEVVEVVGAEEG